MALTFAFVVYAARYFGVEGYGKYALTLNLFEMFLSLSATGLCILVTRETAKDHTWLARNMGAAVKMVTLLGIGAAGVLVAVSQLANYAPDTRIALCVAAVALLPASISTLAEAIFVAWERAEFVAIGTAGESFARTGLCFLLLWSGYGIVSLFVVLIGTRVAQLLLYSVLVARRLPVAEWKAEPGAAGGLVRQWKVFAAENWLSTLSNGMDVLLLSLFHGEAAVGIYDAAWKLIRLSAVIARSFTTAVFPYIARLYVRAEDTFHRVSLHSIKYILAGLLPVVICISVLSERIVFFLYGAKFASSVPVLQVLAWLMIPQFLNPFLSHTLFARHQQSRSLIVAIVNLSAFVAVAFCLIPPWGPVGAAVAVLSAAMTAFGCYLAFCVWGHNTLKLLVILLRQTIAASVLCTFLYCMRNSDLLPVVLIGALLYTAMLVALRIVTWSDFKLLQELH
jgi:O-antigen/teichoic acid export membrane protein